MTTTVRWAFWATFLCSVLCGAVSVESADDSRPRMLVVVGSPGTPEFGKRFAEWEQRWKQAALQGGVDYTAVGLAESGETSDRDQWQAWLATCAGEAPHPVWIVMIGHGTFDGRTARFNARGPDVSPQDLADWLEPLQRPVVVVNCTSSSGPFLTALSRPGRVIVTATKSGHEYNFARFGDDLSRAIADPAADLDKDDQTSLLEAWLKASAAVREFYASESRLTTEHALLDDNGDQFGTPADWFQGLRVTRAARDGRLPDGAAASQLHLVRSREEAQLPDAVRTRRDALEQELQQLRQQKDGLSEDEYLEKLEPLLVQLARLYRETFGK